MLSAVAMIAACSSEFDDAPLWESVNDLEERVGKLEELCRQMNTNLSAMKTIVDAVGSSDYVTGVTLVTKDGKVVGYTIAFYRHEPVTIYHGTDGKDGVNGQDGKDGVNGTDGKDGQDGKDGVNGTDGKDGHSPVVSVRRDTDGNWYWTLDGEWLRDDSGNRIRANGRDGADGKDGADGTDGQDGITPQLKIENEYWYISYDNGRTWTMLGKATSGGDSGSGDGGLFSGVDTSNADYVVFMLGDGTRIQLPTRSAFEALRTLCNQMNTNIESLRKLVEAVQNNDYITSVVPLTENGRAVGYTISFAHSPAIVIYHGKDGADG